MSRDRRHRLLRRRRTIGSRRRRNRRENIPLRRTIWFRSFGFGGIVVVGGVAIDSMKETFRGAVGSFGGRAFGARGGGKSGSGWDSSADSFWGCGGGRGGRKLRL